MKKSKGYNFLHKFLSKIKKTISMKSQFKIIFLTLVLGVFASNSILAQSIPEAKLSSDYGITLSGEDPLGESTAVVETYVIDFSNRAWSFYDAQNAENYFESKSHLIDLQLDYNNKKFILVLDLDAPETVNWDVNQWNHHLVNVR